jgi:subtilase family serine protease
VGEDTTDQYIIAVIDEDNSVAEIDEMNNIILYGPIQ